MNYEKITESLIRNTLEKFELEKIYQEFFDSLIKFHDFKDVPYKKFHEYINQMIEDEKGE